MEALLYVLPQAGRQLRPSEAHLAKLCFAGPRTHKMQGSRTPLTGFEPASQARSNLVHECRFYGTFLFRERFRAKHSGFALPCKPFGLPGSFRAQRKEKGSRKLAFYPDYTTGAVI